jgi:hypothetical protein
MTKKSIFVSALLFTLAAVSLWQWQRHTTQVRLQRRTQWQAYLQGPLSDYLYASTRSHELLKMKKFKPADKQALGEAVLSMRSSWQGMVKMTPQWREDPFFSDLVTAAAWHAEAAQLADTWPRLDLRDKTLMDTARSAAEGISRNLALKLDAQRAKVIKELKPSKDEVLEMNALIYAVKEGTDQVVPRTEKP